MNYWNLPLKNSELCSHCVLKHLMSLEKTAQHLLHSFNSLFFHAVCKEAVQLNETGNLWWQELKIKKEICKYTKAFESCHQEQSYIFCIFWPKFWDPATAWDPLWRAEEGWSKGSVKLRNLSCIWCFSGYVLHPTSGNTIVLQTFLCYSYISLQSLSHCSQQTFVIEYISSPRMYVEFMEFSLERKINL